MLGSWGASGKEAAAGGMEAVRHWEELNGIWEASGEIAGVACTEHPVLWHPGYGEIFVQRHPDHLDLLEEMIAYGERRFLHPEKKMVYVFVYEDDDVLQHS